jgi:hypothetical protein
MAEYNKMQIIDKFFETSEFIPSNGNFGKRVQCCREEIRNLDTPSFVGYHDGPILKESKLKGRVPNLERKFIAYEHAVSNPMEFTGIISNLKNFPDVIKVLDNSTFYFLKQCMISYSIYFTRRDVGTSNLNYHRLYMRNESPDEIEPCFLGLCKYYPTGAGQNNSREPSQRLLLAGDTLRLEEYISYCSYNNDDTKLENCYADWWFRMDIEPLSNLDQ